jgi:hypothetical protein
MSIDLTVSAFLSRISLPSAFAAPLRSLPTRSTPLHRGDACQNSSRVGSRWEVDGNSSSYWRRILKESTILSIIAYLLWLPPSISNACYISSQIIAPRPLKVAWSSTTFAWGSLLSKSLGCCPNSQSAFTPRCSRWDQANDDRMPCANDTSHGSVSSWIAC